MWSSRFISSSIARRMGFGFAGILFLLIASATVSSLTVRSMGNQLKQIAEVNNLKTRLANDLMNHISELAVRTRNAAQYQDASAPLGDEVAKIQVTQTAYLQAETELQSVMDRFGATEEELSLLQAIVAARKQTLPLIAEAIKLGTEGDIVSAGQVISSKIRPQEILWHEKVARLVVLQDKLSAQVMGIAFDRQRQSLVVQAILVTSSLLVGGFIAWWITRSVTRPIGRAVVVAERIAEGDLTSTIVVETIDETGRLLQAMQAMQGRLRNLVGEIRGSADHIQSTSADVAAGNLDLSTRTEQTSAHLHQTASSLAQLTQIVKQSNESARQAQLLAEGAAAVAARGGAVVAEVISTMDQIQSSSKQIAEIIGVIDGIAFQTNILALNAAVESSRAGEQGRGFAVVAGEVRNLAGRSAEAARQIKTLIGTSVQKVEGGSRLVADAGRTMQEIVGSVQSVNHMIGEITSASSAQFHDISQVDAAVGQLDRMTQQNSALVEESSAAAEALKEQAMRLGQMVGVFYLDRHPPS